MNLFKKSIILSLVLLLLCGFIYPLTMTGISQLMFKKQANGSIITLNGKEVGSELIGQSFTDPRFFRGRVSGVNYNTYTDKDKNAVQDGKPAYNGVGSGSQNLAPSNKMLADRVQKDISDFLKSHPGVKKEDIPTDLLTSSGSGLDPDISPEAARVQISAVSKATGINNADLEEIIGRHTKNRTLGIFGEPRVNVLGVNIEIADILKKNGKL